MRGRFTSWTGIGVFVRARISFEVFAASRRRASWTLRRSGAGRCKTDLSCTLFGVAIARSAYRLLITLFVLGVVVQFYLAGAGVFRAHGPGKAVDSSAFDPHRTLGDVLIILSVLVLLAALAGRNGRWMFAFALVVLMVVALFVAHASSWGGAFHPVIGLLIFGLSGSMAGAAWRAHRAAASGAP